MEPELLDREGYRKWHEQSSERVEEDEGEGHQRCVGDEDMRHFSKVGERGGRCAGGLYGDGVRSWVIVGEGVYLVVLGSGGVRLRGHTCPSEIDLDTTHVVVD